MDFVDSRGEIYNKEITFDVCDEKKVFLLNVSFVVVVVFDSKVNYHKINVGVVVYWSKIFFSESTNDFSVMV